MPLYPWAIRSHFCTENMFIPVFTKRFLVQSSGLAEKVPGGGREGRRWLPGRRDASRGPRSESSLAVLCLETTQLSPLLGRACPRVRLGPGRAPLSVL